MNSCIIVDAGPLVALLNRREQYHTWARETIPSFPVPFVTCEAVISEACFLLSSVHGGEAALLTLLERGKVITQFRLDGEVAVIRNLMQRYSSVPMSFADACLVRMSERISNSAVLTLDSDFFIYRKNGSEAIHVITPTPS